MGEKLPLFTRCGSYNGYDHTMTTHKTKIFETALFQSLHVVNPLPTIAFDNADRRKNIHCRQE